MFDDAITYADRHTLHALLIALDGQIAVERSGAGREPAQPHALYSGTKSFWGIAALAADEEGRLELDAPIGPAIPEWPAAAQHAGITVRQLLSLTAGYGFGGLGNAVPTPQRALDIPLKTAPGTAFTYGGIPLQIFGEVLRRKLAPDYQSAHDYLATRVLAPIGMTIDTWRRLADGTRPLPTGAFARASEWLKYGMLLLAGGAGVIGAASFTQCITGSAFNPRYGLGLWLTGSAADGAPFYASGAGGQALYVLPRRRIVAVHFGQSSSWSHGAFLKRLEAG